MDSFSLIFARGKRFVAAFEIPSGLLKVWDIEEAIRNSTPDVTVCLPSPCWSIRWVGGDLFFIPYHIIIVHPVYSSHQDYQMILFKRQGYKVNVYIFLSTRDLI